MKKNKKNNKKKYGLGITGRLVLCFTCFVVFLIAIIWIFQIMLLDKFYQNTKKNELSVSADQITLALGTDNLSTVSYSCSVKYHLCIRVFSISDEGLGDEVCDIENSQVCIIHHMPSEVLEMYYNKALDQSGYYIETFKPYSYPDLIEDDSDDSADDEETKARNKFGKNGVNAIASTQVFTADIVTGSDGETYVIFLDTEYSPLLTTKSTLKMQFSWISLGTLLLATVLALIFARTITRPLVKMTASAKKMAGGDYTPDFPVSGYKETMVLAETLNYAASEISKADRMQKELIANVSHDLRTPLTMISGYAEVMRDIPGENTPENVQVIIDESKRLTSLVNDLLDLSKMEAGTKQPVKTVFDLTETVREVMGRYSTLIMHDGYQVSFEATENVSIYADRIMILQVIYNLINNAINYTGDDKKVFVTQEVNPEKTRVKIKIRDTGEGISKENIPLIWDRYYKVDKLHKRATVGSGLGLSIVRNALQLHSASYGVESTEGVGSTFWFEMDIAHSDQL